MSPDIRRVLNSSKVSDHHAIIPTVQLDRQNTSELPQTEQNIMPEKKVEKASIRDQLKAAAKERAVPQKPDKQKSKGLEME